MFDDLNIREFLVSMVALIICITIHEFSHAMAAVRAGDDTPRKQGRISLNPMDHLDPIGTLMMVVSSLSHFGFGWGKAVRINPNNFRSPRWDNLKVSLWGPLSNILMAAAVGLSLRFFAVYIGAQAAELLGEVMFISLVLAFFNLIPIAPLDGSHIMSSLLPRELAQHYDMFMGQYGFMVFLGLIFLAPNLLPHIIGPPVTMFLHLILGPV